MLTEVESQETKSHGPNPFLCFILLVVGFMLFTVIFWSVVLWNIEPEHHETH